VTVPSVTLSPSAGRLTDSLMDYFLLVSWQYQSS